MSYLREIDLSSNRIVELPFELGDLTKLKVLNVSHNVLAQLPHSLGECSLREYTCVCMYMCFSARMHVW
jgi:Leucine-rich repeat (LRR) protein